MPSIGFCVLCVLLCLIGIFVSYIHKCFSRHVRFGVGGIHDVAVGFMFLIPQITHTHTLWISVKEFAFWHVASQRCVLASILLSCCILGRFCNHPPEGTWYWAKPTKMANAEHLTQQMTHVQMARHTMPWMNVWHRGVEAPCTQKAFWSHNLSLPPKLLSWIPWFSAQTKSFGNTPF